MRKEKVREDNVKFFLLAVGRSFGTDLFAQAVLASASEVSQFPTDNVGYPGYIRIDTSAIGEAGGDLWFDFVEEVRNRLLSKASYEFSSRTEFEGDLAEQMAFEKGGYLFNLRINQYERDGGHKFEPIGPEILPNIPEEEELGRMVYLTIAPKEN